MDKDVMTTIVSMARSRRSFFRGIVICGLLAITPIVHAFESPLDQAAMRSDHLSYSPMFAIAISGSRLVAAGLRGGIIISEDQGKSWTQAEVPVSVDLVAIAFPSEKKGWAVGHGGIVLHSEDGGLTWKKQLDGFQASKLAIDFYTNNTEHLDNAAELLTKEQNLVVDKETQPFLDVFFTDDQHGYVVGTFNRIFATSDGGQHWVPQMHLTDNPQEWHFYSISGIDGQLYITGEQGQVWRLEPQTHHFVSIGTPYKGTLFGVMTAEDGQLYAYGMRGSFFRSSNQGKNWERSPLPFNSSVVRALSLGSNHLLVISQNGEVAQSSDGGQSFKALHLENPMPYYGAALVDRTHLALAGALGVRIEAF